MGWLWSNKSPLVWANHGELTISTWVNTSLNISTKHVFLCLETNGRLKDHQFDAVRQVCLKMGYTACRQNLGLYTVKCTHTKRGQSWINRKSHTHFNDSLMMVGWPKTIYQVLSMARTVSILTYILTCTPTNSLTRILTDIRNYWYIHIRICVLTCFLNTYSDMYIA
jgi:hypothetical protein